MDNETMVETFKFLNYRQLATRSLVSKRYWNMIRTHRHKLALLDVDEISMHKYVEIRPPAVIKMFNQRLSPKEYNQWIICSGYSTQIPLEGQIAMKKSTENDRAIYALRAKAVSQNPNHIAVLYAHAELKNENGPLFQHFARLATDPFIYIRTLELIPQMEVLIVLAEAMTPGRNRLQCKQMNIYFTGDTQKSIVWIKDHVRCDEFEIYVRSFLNYDEELLDLFLTGAPCTSAIYVKEYDFSKVIVDLVQMFMGFKNRDECQVVESIRGDVEDREALEELMRNYAEFVADEKQYDKDLGTRQIIGFINNGIGKKLAVTVTNFPVDPSLSFFIKITNL